MRNHRANILLFKRVSEIVDRKLTTVSADCTYTWKESIFNKDQIVKKKKKNCDFWKLY